TSATSGQLGAGHYTSVVRQTIQWSGIVARIMPIQGTTSQYLHHSTTLSTDLQPIIAVLLARFDTKVSPIPSSNCFVSKVVVLSPRRLGSHRARTVGALQKGTCCTDQPPEQDEVVLRGNRAHRVCFGLLGT